MPALTLAREPALVTSSPSNVMRPPIDRVEPEDRCGSSCVLPLPLWPSTPTISPCADRAGRRRTRPACGRSRPAGPRRRASARDRRRRRRAGCGDGVRRFQSRPPPVAACSVSSAIVPSAVISPELHEVRVVGEPADDVQVVLDDADRAALLAHRLDQVEHRVDPLRVDAGRRLVEQQHLGLGGQHPGQRDQLGLAVRQRAGRHVGELGHADEPQPVHRLARVVAPRRASTRPWAKASVAKFSPGWSCTAIITFCRQDSRLNSRTSWNERTMPLRATCVGFEPDELLAVQLAPSRASGGMNAGEQVEHRRLAGAVRADEGGDRALAQLDVQVVGGDDAAEALADSRSVSSTTGASLPRPARGRLSSPSPSGAPSASTSSTRSARCDAAHRVACGTQPRSDHLDARRAAAFAAQPAPAARSPPAARPAAGPASARRAARP